MRRAYRELVAHTLLVNLTTGKAFRGVLRDEHPAHITLANATLHEDGTAAQVDGEVIIPRERIEFLQVVPAEVMP
jgi:small nuclear ribonucleoprotein (snRNP)-like protein